MLLLICLYPVRLNSLQYHLGSFTRHMLFKYGIFFVPSIWILVLVSMSSLPFLICLTIDVRQVLQFIFSLPIGDNVDNIIPFILWQYLRHLFFMLIHVNDLIILVNTKGLFIEDDPVLLLIRCLNYLDRSGCLNCVVSIVDVVSMASSNCRRSGSTADGDGAINTSKC